MTTEKTINYNTPDQSKFKHTEAEVLIGPNGANFKSLPPAENQIYKATGKVKANADYARDDNVGIFFRGSAKWDQPNSKYDLQNPSSADYMSLNDDSVRDGLTKIPKVSHFNTDTNELCIRFKIEKLYNGAPPTTYYVFGSGNSTVMNGLGSLLTLLHDPSGTLFLGTRGVTGVSQINPNMGSWVPSVGTVQEFEFNINLNTFTVGFYINGTLKASGNIANIGSGLDVRDFFYFSNYYLQSGFKGSLNVTDIEFFDKIQHTEDFTDEIPRNVCLFAQESLIEPQEFSTAEGFFGVTHVPGLTGDADTKYLLKIESEFYWIDGGVLSVSDKTFAQSSSVATWNLPATIIAVDDFISAGARITMVPIIYSGVNCDSNLLLKSTTLSYNFFVLPVGCNQCTLYGFVSENCVDIESGTITVYVEDPVNTQGTIQAFVENEPIRLPDGYFEVPVVIPNLPVVEGRKDDFYFFRADWVDINGKEWTTGIKKILIPNQPTVLYGDKIIKKGR